VHHLVDGEGVVLELVAVPGRSILERDSLGVAGPPGAGAGGIGSRFASASISVSWSRKSGTPCSSSAGVACGARRADALPRQRSISSDLFVLRNSCNIAFSRLAWLQCHE
jgi:hypothetical protein